MSSNKKKTDAIPLGDDNSVNRETTQTNVNEQGQTAGQENPASEPARPADKESGCFRFGRRAKATPVKEEPAPANEKPAPPQEAPQPAKDQEAKPEANADVPEGAPKMEQQPENPVSENLEAPGHAPQDNKKPEAAEEVEVTEDEPKVEARGKSQASCAARFLWTNFQWPRSHWPAGAYLPSGLYGLAGLLAGPQGPGPVLPPRGNQHDGLPEFGCPGQYA